MGAQEKKKEHYIQLLTGGWHASATSPGFFVFTGNWGYAIK